jgi:hypothetical protein
LSFAAAGVTDEQLLATQHTKISGIKPHFVMDSFGDLRRVAAEALQQQQQQKQQQQSYTAAAT